MDQLDELAAIVKHELCLFGKLTNSTYQQVNKCVLDRLHDEWLYDYNTNGVDETYHKQDIQDVASRMFPGNEIIYIAWIEHNTKTNYLFIIFICVLATIIILLIVQHLRNKPVETYSTKKWEIWTK